MRLPGWLNYNHRLLVYPEKGGATLNPRVAGGTTHSLYGNQQVSLTTEKKRGLSYEREKEAQPPSHPPHTASFLFYPVGVAAATTVMEQKMCKRRR